MKLITIAIIAIVVALMIWVSFIILKGGEPMKNKLSEKFQGPVRPTDDLEHFRNTGETIPLEQDG